MNRIGFQQIAEVRLRESKALLDAGFPDGAYYLAGYAVECALKACIARRTQQHDFPDKKLVDKSYTHDVEKLLDAAGLKDNLAKDIGGNKRLEMEWEFVKSWSEQSRYVLLEGEDSERKKSAFLMIFSVESEGGGVLRWIKQYW